MMRVAAAGRTDVGQVRDVNEDAFHVGDSVFAVADGMGGHLAGEIASSTALGPVITLDGRVFPDADTATAALRDAVVDANNAVVTKAAGDPSYRGMGTTLTAVMVEGRRAHIAHVGDSRAYLLRDGGFSQLTTDHTLVQRMVAEGRLTEEEAASHPHRSVITRAIGVEDDVEVDAMTLDLEPGDTVLLCSDGLTGVVDDDVIADVLETERDDVDVVARELIELANQHGAPDNVTCVVLHLDELETAPGPRRGARGGPAVVVRTQPDDQPGDWALRLGRLGPRGGPRAPATEDHPPRRTTRTQRIAAIVVAVGLLSGAVLAGGRWLLSRSYYLGIAGERVTIFQGVPADLGPFDLSWEYEATSLLVSDLPPFLVSRLEDGVAAASPDDARSIVATYRSQVDDADDEPAEASPTEPDDGGPTDAASTDPSDDPTAETP